MKARLRCSRNDAFTLTELLVVIVTLALIVVLPCLASNRDRMNRVVCLNNLRQMGMGSQLYATDDPKGSLSGSLMLYASPQSDDLNWLYGYGQSRTKYIQDLQTAICPATQNSIRTNIGQLQGYTVLVDLRENGQSPTSFGHSYEVVSYISLSGGVAVYKTLQNTATLKRTKEPLLGQIPGPSMIVLIHEALENYTTGSVNNYPNPYAGHGEEGDNMLFCDGHAEWIGTKDWSSRFILFP